jgi:hypothetical protein
MTNRRRYALLALIVLGASTPLSAQRIDGRAGLHALPTAPVAATTLEPRLAGRKLSSGEKAGLAGFAVGIAGGILLGLAFDEHNPLRLLAAGVVIGVPCAVIAALLFGGGSPSP